MPLHPDCTKKVMDLGAGEAINRGFLDLFNAIVNEKEIDGSDSGTIIVPFYDKNSGLQEGDWAAELHFVARKVKGTDENQETEA